MRQNSEEWLIASDTHKRPWQAWQVGWQKPLYVQISLESFQGPDNLSEQPVPVLHHPQKEKISWCLEVASCVPVCVHCPLSSHWEPLKTTWLHPLNPVTSGVFWLIHTDHYKAASVKTDLRSQLMGNTRETKQKTARAFYTLEESKFGLQTTWQIALDYIDESRGLHHHETRKKILHWDSVLPAQTMHSWQNLTCCRSHETLPKSSPNLEMDGFNFLPIYINYSIPPNGYLESLLLHCMFASV